MDAAKSGYPYELGAEDPFKMPPPVIPECPLCAGKVSRDDPAAQALGWGIRVAEAKEGESDFWKAATVCEVLDSTPAVCGGQIDEFTSAVRKAAVSTAYQTVPADSDDAAADSPTVPVLPDSIRFGPEEEPDGGGSSRPNACCLVTFKYPIKTPSVRPPKERASGLIDLGWDFEVLAVFRNTGKDATGRDCDCACCRFKQMVEGVNQQHIPGAEEQKAEVKGEDCRDVMVGGQRKRICYGRGTLSCGTPRGTRTIRTRS